MNGTANLNSASRPHYASSIPVPRATSQTKIHALAASPQLRPRQHSLVPSPQRAASPRLGKAIGSPSCSSPKTPRGRGSAKTPAGLKESSSSGHEKPEAGESYEGHSSQSLSSPWSSPRVTPKALSSSRAGPRRTEEVQVIGGKKKRTPEGIRTSQAQSRSPSRISPHRDTPTPGASESRKPLSFQGKDQDVNFKGSGIARPIGPEDESQNEIPSQTSSSVISPVYNKGSSPNLGTISFSSASQQNHPVTATVAPFQYRYQAYNSGGLPLYEDYLKL